MDYSVSQLIGFIPAGFNVSDSVVHSADKDNYKAIAYLSRIDSRLAEMSCIPLEGNPENRISLTDYSLALR